MTSIMLILSLVLRCWKLCAATAASHRLAYEWAQAHNTKVGWLLCFFRREGRSSDNTCDCPIFDNYRTPTRMITVLLRRDGTTNCCRYLAYWHVATVCYNSHRHGCFGCAKKVSDYLWWPIIDFFTLPLVFSNAGSLLLVILTFSVWLP